MADKALIIKFAKNAKELEVSSHSRAILKKIMKESKITSITISSTARDSYNQARVMYANIAAHGSDAQKKLYASAGDKVIDVYTQAKKDKKGKAATIKLMKAKIVAVGARKVSNHSADPKKLNVFDVAPSSIPKVKRKEWEKAIAKSTEVKKYIFPPKDPGYHFEIVQPEKKVPAAQVHPHRDKPSEQVRPHRTKPSDSIITRGRHQAF